jgi:tripartite-type tricarboxylate transporter receptor subunit TctC
MVLRLLAVVLAAVAVGAASVVHAQSYPAKPVRIVVPYAPGGGNDLVARFLAQRLASSLGQPFIVENRPGAGGSIGVEAGLRAAPDGYTLTFIPSSYTAYPSLYRLSYDPVADIAPIIQLAVYPLLIVVNAGAPVKSTAELIKHAQAGSLNYASPGSGTTIQLATELFATMAQVHMNHVPYKGSAPALADTLAGRIDVYFTSLAPALPHLRSGRLRAIAVTGNRRIASLPEVPTVAESGVPGYEVFLWYGLAGPKGMPRAIVERLNAEVSRTLGTSEAGQHFEADGMSPAGGTPEQFLATIRREIDVWRKVIVAAGVRVE